MSKKTDAFTYTILGFAAIIIVIYNFIVEYYLEIIYVVVCCLALYYFIKHLSKKYGWLGFLPDYLVKNQKEIIKIESLYKEKFGTRAFGLNEN